MRYLLLIYGAEPTEPPSEEAIAAEMDAYGQFTREMAARGIMRGGEALEPTSTATTVRVRDGRVAVTDGPFAETKEALGGYYLIDVPNLDEAIEVASKIPGARRGSIEVRPIWEVPGPEALAADVSARA